MILATALYLNAWYALYYDSLDVYLFNAVPREKNVSPRHGTCTTRSER